jgi:hypothetical protein
VELINSTFILHRLPVLLLILLFCCHGELVTELQHLRILNLSNIILKLRTVLYLGLFAYNSISDITYRYEYVYYLSQYKTSHAVKLEAEDHFTEISMLLF